MRKNKFIGEISTLTREEILAQMIRVNQAGEYGAKRIYQGQMRGLKNDKCLPIIKHMAEQEEEHLAYFNEQIVKRKVRPTALMPLWHVAGYGLGLATALLGKKAAMACTVAVEEVIDAHYKEQLELLDDFYADEKDLKKQIAKFRDEELEHRDTGIKNEAQQAVGYHLLSNVIKLSSKLAIELAKRF